MLNLFVAALFLIGMFILVWALHDLGAASLRFEDINRMAPQLGAAPMSAQDA